jgi:glutamine synthetase
MGIFWGDRNRLAMVRVPLGWTTGRDMVKHANPHERGKGIDASDSATVEFRCPDGSADVYLTLAGLAVAARHGLEMRNGLTIAQRLYAAKGAVITLDEWEGKKAPKIPTSCHESAENLLNDRETYQRDGVFTPEVIDGVAKRLQSYFDKDLVAKSKPDELKRMMDELIHCA